MARERREKGFHSHLSQRRKEEREGIEIPRFFLLQRRANRVNMRYIVLFGDFPAARFFWYGTTKGSSRGDGRRITLWRINLRGRERHLLRRRKLRRVRGGQLRIFRLIVSSPFYSCGDTWGVTEEEEEGKGPAENRCPKKICM